MRHADQQVTIAMDKIPEVDLLYSHKAGHQTWYHHSMYEKMALSDCYVCTSIHNR